MYVSTIYNVEFDNNADGIYYSGEKVSGTIRLTTTKPKIIRGISIYGIGRVKTDVYGPLEKEVLSIGGYRLSSPTDVTLSDDTHNIRFEFDLPADLPSSLYESFGKIEYKIVTTIKRSRNYRHYDNIFEHPFAVIRTVDLNLNPSNQLPISEEDAKYFMCLCCLNGPAMIRLDLPYSGYVPGQSILYCVYVENHSNFDIEKVKIYLKQILQFRSNEFKAEDCKIKEKRILKDSCGPVLRFTNKEFKGSLKLPFLLPSSENEDDLIVTRYEISAVIQAAFYQCDKTISVPVAIGTIPMTCNTEAVAVPVFLSVQRTTHQLAWQSTFESNPRNDNPAPAYTEVVRIEDPPSYENILRDQQPQNSPRSRTVN